MSTRRDELLIGIDARLPLWQYVWFWVQQLTVDASALIVPVLIGAALHLRPDQVAHIVQACLIGAGLVTIGQALVILRLPVLQGPAVVYIAIVTTVAVSFGLAAAWTAIWISGLIVAALAWPLHLWGRMRNLFAAAPIYGTFLILVSLFIGGALLGNIIGRPGTADFGNGLNFILGALPLVIALLLVLLFPRSILRYSSVIIGALVTLAAAAAWGRVNFSAVGRAAWVGLPQAMPFGFDLRWPAVLLVFVGYFFNLFEVVGTYILVGEVIGKQGVDSRRIEGGILTEGLDSAISGFFGGMATNSYMQNTGAIALTGIGSRFVFATAGGVLLILGLVPKIGAVAASLPAPIVGGLLLTTVAMLCMQGIRVLGEMPPTNLNLMTAGVGIVVGATSVPPAFFALLPAWIRPFLSSGLVVGLFASVALYVVLGTWLHLDRHELKAVVTAQQMQDEPTLLTR